MVHHNTTVPGTTGVSNNIDSIAILVAYQVAETRELERFSETKHSKPVN